MTSPFSDMLEAAFDVAEEFAGVTITYRNEDGLTATTNKAILGRLTSDSADGEQADTDSEFVSIIVPRGFPSFGAGWTEPKPGDQVEYWDSIGATRLLELRPPLGAEPCWRFTDSNQTRIRLNCKYVEDVP